jgi:hypothetical protein
MLSPIAARFARGGSHEQRLRCTKPVRFGDFFFSGKWETHKVPPHGWQLRTASSFRLRDGEGASNRNDRSLASAQRFDSVSCVTASSKRSEMWVLLTGKSSHDVSGR